ncbi:MAG TPA: ATP-binding protein [Abditibacteriaceae bacterium]|jgi:signal transduction histidine kinase
MQQFHIVPWLQLTLSLFNAILLLWLGLTVLINAERRSLGVCLAGGGMLLGSAFFLAHSAMLFYDLGSLVLHINLWWYGGWLALIALPLAWFSLMLWYAGFWDDDHSPLHRRQRPWLAVLLCAALAMTALIATTDPRYLLRHVALVAMSSATYDNRVLVLIGAYPLYLLACIGAALDALGRPALTTRFMGDLARSRARPWLLTTTLLQFVVSLMVASGLIWIVFRVLRDDLDQYMGGYGGIVWSFDVWDTVICALIGASVVLMGKTVMSYEIFSGKTLPRRGFLRQWRYIVLVAAAYSAFVSTCLEFDWHPIFPLLLTTAAMSVLLALWNWRSHLEREQSIENLRPFVASQKLYQHLVESPASSSDTAQIVDAATPFRALCESVLNAESAHLVPLGTLAPLAGAALNYPPGGNVILDDIESLKAQLDSPRTICLQLHQSRWNGAQWAVPLWSERGLIGVLLLGEKRDGSLYAQEEIEIARSSGERLIDMQAGAAMAQRLMALQQQRLTHNQVVDGRVRRVLHDEILPQLHATMLSLSTRNGAQCDSIQSNSFGANGSQPNGSQPDEAVAALADVHRQVSNLLREMPPATAPSITRLGLMGALRQCVSQEFKNAFESIEWCINDSAEKQSQNVSSLAAEVTFYAAREALCNAARYGRGSDAARALHLRIQVQSGRELQITIEDDGVGIARHEYSDGAGHNAGGSGQGLILHSTMMAVAGGQLSTESIVPHGTRVVLLLPLGV